MFFYNCLAEKCADDSENKAENKQYTDSLSVYGSEQIIAVFCGISSLKHILAVVLCCDDDREVISAYPQAEYSVTDGDELEALIISFFGKQIGNKACCDYKRSAEPAHTCHEHDNCD